MKIKKVNTNTTRLFLVAAAAVVVMLLFVSITPIFGQKDQAERATTRDGLTESGFMTNPQVSDDLDGTDDEYFYKFAAGPGKLTVTVEVIANQTNAGAMLDLFGTNSKAILSNMLVQAANGGSERIIKSVNIAKKQDVIIRIKGLRYGSSAGYPGTYKIRLEGTAVKFNAPPDATGQDKNPDAAPSDGPVEVKKPDVTPSDAPGQDKKQEAAPSDGTVEVTKPEEAPPDITPEVKKPDDPPSDATGKEKKPDVVDRVIEKGKTKSKKLLNLLDKVKAKIPG
jgi:hypothetical protein